MTFLAKIVVACCPALYQPCVNECGKYSQSGGVPTHAQFSTGFVGVSSRGSDEKRMHTHRLLLAADRPHFIAFAVTLRFARIISEEIGELNQARELDGVWVHTVTDLAIF